MTSETTYDTAAHHHTSRCWWNHELAGWNCHDSRPASSAERPLVDVRDMIVVHNALLREIRLLAPAVAATPTGATRRVASVARHLAFLTDLLHHHHAGEDALLWPLMRQRLPAPAIEAIDAAEAQHEQIDERLAQVVRAGRTWAGRPHVDNRDVLVADLRILHALLSDHLDFEERRLLPLAASVLTDAEWHAIGEAAVAALPKPALPLTFGMFAYEGDPVVLRDMLRSAPAVPRLLLPRVAPRVYRFRAAQVYGTARP